MSDVSMTLRSCIGMRDTRERAFPTNTSSHPDSTSDSPSPKPSSTSKSFLLQPLHTQNQVTFIATLASTSNVLPQSRALPLVPVCSYVPIPLHYLPSFECLRWRLTFKWRRFGSHWLPIRQPRYLWESAGTPRGWVQSNQWVSAGKVSNDVSKLYNMPQTSWIILSLSKL